MGKICNVTEALIEALLEQQAYSEVQVSQHIMEHCMYLLSIISK